MSLTDGLRAGDPQAFGALYDEYAGALYAYCHVMVGDEAAGALHDVFSTVARHRGATPDTDAELPVWLHSLARAECVRYGAFVRGVVSAKAADPLRRALALLSPDHREVLALSNVLDPEQTSEVLGVTRDTAEALVREAKWQLEEAAASVGEQEPQDSVIFTALSGEALHRLVTLGYEPPAEEREWVLSSYAAAERTPGGAAVFDADGTPLPLDAFSAQADDATHQFSIASLHEVEADTGEQPPLFHGAHARRTEPFLGRRFLPVVALVAACVAAAAGVALAWHGTHEAHPTSASVHQSVRPGEPTPSGDQASPPAAADTPDASPTPTGTSPTAAAPSSGTAPADGSGSATSPKPTKHPAKPTKHPTTRPTKHPTWHPTRPTKHPTWHPTRPTKHPTWHPTRPPWHPTRPTTKPKPRHTAARGDGYWAPDHRGPGRACDSSPSRCARPHPSRPRYPTRPRHPSGERPRW